MSALFLGTAIALVAVAYVLVPLFRDDLPGSRGRASLPSGPRADERPGETTTAVAALREIEFDRATGKLSDVDYRTLKARYTEEALATMRAAETARLTSETLAGAEPATSGAASSADLAEEMILRYRRGGVDCATCGPRPEPDAVYCSTCGRYLAATCPGCGTAVTEAAARFCASCGRSLAA
jgi:hypothetical protein